MRLASSGVIRSCTTLNVYTNSDTDGRDEWLIERAAQDGFKVQVLLIPRTVCWLRRPLPLLTLCSV